MQDWTSVISATTPTKKVCALDCILERLLDECFPQKVFCIKSSDDPWINQSIKKLVKKRKREFKKNGRSARWKQLKKETNEEIENAKKEFFAKGRKKAKEEKNSSAFYKVVNCVKDGEAPKQFDIKKLKPDMSTAELALSLIHI